MTVRASVQINNYCEGVFMRNKAIVLCDDLCSS